MGAKELGQAYNQSEQVTEIIKYYATMPSVLQFLTYIPETFLGQSCGHPDKFTRFVHLLNWYLQIKESGHWEQI